MAEPKNAEDLIVCELYHPANQATLDACIAEGLIKPVTYLGGTVDENFDPVGEKPTVKESLKDEQNEMEEYLKPIDYDFIDHEAQFHIQEIYNKLLAEKEELEKDYKNDVTCFEDWIKTVCIEVPDLTPEERQQIKDYAQKLRDERKLKMKPCPFCGSDKVEYIKGDGVICMNCEALMPENDRLKDKERKIDCISEWNKRIYTADEMEGK